jgi:uncharacterized damage-inducible protein DinB
MKTQIAQIHELVLKEVRRRILGEFIPRIEKCLILLSQDEVWFRPNDQSNSTGNLVLHVCGNARQWICSGLGNQPDNRIRQLEFDERGPISKTVLLDILKSCGEAIQSVLEMVKTQDLTKPITVQGFDETGISILIHVTEHFSYHTGQIVYLTKWLKNADLGFYSGQDLDLTGK